MVVISSAELRSNMKKYLDIAKTEQVLIQRGENETFVLVAQQNPVEYDISFNSKGSARATHSNLCGEWRLGWYC